MSQPTDPPISDRSPSPRSPGVRSIAKATGLSVATVSRVLNNSPSVRAETRDLVLAAMQEQGYAPNAAARALSTRRTHTIAAVVPTLAHSIFATFLNVVERELAADDYGLIVATTAGSPADTLRRAQELLELGAEGLILSGLRHPRELLDLIARRKVPAVCTSIFDPRAPLPTIGYDNQALGKAAMSYLQGQGHRRIAVVHGPLANNDRTELRLKGVQDAMRQAMELSFFEDSLAVAGGASAAGKILSQAAPPTAILCLSDVLALGVLFEAARRGITVPQDISVMGFDDLDWAQFAAPPLTTIQLPTAEMGRRAAAALKNRLDHGQEILSAKLDAEIIERETVAPPPG